MAKKLNNTHIEFIISNKDKMKQKEIARHLNVSPSHVSKLIGCKSGNIFKNENMFNVDDFAKYYQP